MILLYDGRKNIFSLKQITQGEHLFTSCTSEAICLERTAKDLHTAIDCFCDIERPLNDSFTIVIISQQ